MLETALQPLKLDIFNALKCQEVQEAFAKAIKSTFPPGAGDEFDDQAKVFGQIITSYVAPALASPLAEAIHKYVKQMGITINVLPTEVSSSMGPCAGVITPMNVKIT